MANMQRNDKAPAGAQLNSMFLCYFTASDFYFEKHLHNLVNSNKVSPVKCGGEELMVSQAGLDAELRFGLMDT